MGSRNGKRQVISHEQRRIGREVVGQFVGNDVHNFRRKHHDIRGKIPHDILSFRINVVKRMLDFRKRELSRKISAETDAPAHGDDISPLSVTAKNRVVVKLFNCKHGEPPFKNTHRKRHDSQ